MKKRYDSSKDTMEHIIRVGYYLDIIIDELKNYKKVDLRDDINNITVIDILFLLLHGEENPFSNKLISNIYDNSFGYLYQEEDYLTQDMLYKKYVDELLDRKANHDKTKLEYPEKQEFDKYNQKLKELTYGSEEYKQNLYILRNALCHHYRYNRHHPEHFGNGIYGMSIMDLTEMICDWKASSERQINGNIFDGIQKGLERFSYDKKMVRVLSNTVEKYFLNED